MARAITRPDTPLPWLNYLGQEDFFGLCTNCAGGYSFWRDAKLRRLTHYRYNNIPMDLGGRADRKSLSAIRGVGPEIEAGSGDFNGSSLPDWALRVNPPVFRGCSA